MARWKAKELVRPVWQRWGEEHKIDKAPRDALAEKIGTTGTTLSALNTGSKWMTPKMARRIAKETGVSVLELGATEEEASEADRPVLDRLRSLEAEALLLRRLVLEGFGLLGLQVELEGHPESPLVRRNRRPRQPSRKRS